MILVIGGTGTIGGELIRLLAGAGAGAGVEFAVLARNEEKAGKLQDQGFRAVRGDLTDPGSLVGAMAGADTVFLLSPSVRDQGDLQIGAIDAARTAGVGRIVKLSAIGAAPDAPYLLGREHARAEQYLLASGLDHTILRPGSFMQNMLLTAESIRSRGEFYGSSGSGRIAMIDARDIAAVAFAVLTGRGHEGRTYALSGPEALSNDEAAAILGQALGRAIRYRDIPGPQLREGMVQGGMPEWLADDLVVLEGIFAEGGGAEITGDVEEITGRAPRTFAAFVREYRTAFQPD